MGAKLKRCQNGHLHTVVPDYGSLVVAVRGLLRELERAHTEGRSSVNLLVDGRTERWLRAALDPELVCEEKTAVGPLGGARRREGRK
jgi:hypothetical protein